MAIIYSFSWRYGPRPPAQTVLFDVRAIYDPDQDKALRRLDGRAPQVRERVLAHPLARDFLASARLCLQLGLSVAFGCTGGKHRSVALAEALAECMEEASPVHLTVLAVKAAASARHPAMRALLDRLVPGVHFLRQTDLGFDIYGEVVGGDDEAERQQLVRSHADGYVYGRCYSVACPAGEYGSTHVTRITRVVPPEEFEEARKTGWT